MSDKDKDDILFSPFDATPGEKYRQWRQHLFSHAATKTDESGSSLADSLTDADMGGAAAGAPPLPGGAQRDKMERLRRGRAKAGYALIYKHISDGDLRTILYNQHFQDGHGALQYLDAAYDTPITRSELREMDKLWTELGIARDVGINHDSVSRFAKLLQRVNSQRPAGNRHGNDELCEKLLEAIADSSRHFNEGAMREYNAQPGQRQFEYAAGHPLFANQRNFAACAQYYDNLWRQAVKAKILSVTAPLARAGAAAMLLQATQSAEPATARTQMSSRSTSPTVELRGLAARAVYELPLHVVTTSSFSELSTHDFARAVDDGGQTDAFDIEQCYDAERIPSVELICDNCRGVGHPRRLCPSPRKYRTFDFAMELLRAARDRANARAQQQGGPPGGRRPPPRGQRPPFQPRKPVPQPQRFRAPATARHADEADADAEPEPSSQPLTFDDETYFAHTRESVREDAHAAGPDDEHARLARTGSEKARDDERWLASRLRGWFSLLLSMLAAVVVGTARWGGALSRKALDAAQENLTARVAVIVGCLAFCAAGVLSAAHSDEHLGLIVGCAHLTNVVACVDSGASVTCLSERLAFSGSVDFKQTRRTANRRLRVASDQLLDIVAEGELTLGGIRGFRVVGAERVNSSGDGRFRRVAVVRGLADNIILLSVRSMKENDNIMTYFNTDNASGVEDCIRLPCGLFVPFKQNSYDILVPSPAANASCSLAAAPWEPSLRVHAALCHAGATRVSLSDITYEGKPLPPMPPPHACAGCRLGGGRAPASRRGRKRAQPHGPAVDRGPLEYFGQLVSSDCCVGLPASFPHGFTSMINFCDGYSGERDRRFLTRADSSQVLSALTEYRETNRHRLRDGKIDVWQTDNGKEFRGECATDAVDELLRVHDYTVPNNKNSNAVAERDWGVIQRGMRACIAYAGAPECLWPWAANQCSLVYHYLATTVHQPPVSAHAFLHPGRGPVDMSWARTLFCDVTVALPERDVHGKVCHRATDGCHLGYDARRRGHIVYCPKERRLGTFTVTHWCGENSFTLCKLISSDTPVEYHQVDDLPMPPSTAALLPSQFRATPRFPSGAGAGSAREVAARRAALAAQRRKEGDDFAALAGENECLLCRPRATEKCEELGMEADFEHATSSANAPELPDTVEKAKSSPFWPMVKDALESEIKGKFVDNQAWEVVQRTPNMHVIRSKWVLKWKLRTDGSVESVKARLVACGYGQVAGREYTAVYARTLAAPSFRLFCSIVADEDLETDHIDFLSGGPSYPTIDCV